MITQETEVKEKKAARNKMPCTTKGYQKGLDLAETGKLAEALECFQKYLDSSPNNAEILNDIGAIFHCMHRSNEAIKYFLKANELKPGSAEILWNLSETYLATGQAKQAAELFDEMQKLSILNAEVLTRTAEIMVNAGELADALKILNKSIELWPNQSMLLPMIETINSKMAENKN